jgi:hypothetical protein
MSNEANEVFINGQGIIEIHVVGDQDEDSVRAMGESAMRLAEECRQAGKPVLLLDNLLRMGEVPPAGRRIVVEYGKKIEYDRLAMLGNGPLLRLGANLLIKAVGKAGRVRYFDDEAAALRWLLEG